MTPTRRRHLLLGLLAGPALLACRGEAGRVAAAPAAPSVPAPAGPTGPVRWPLRADPSSRHLVDAAGAPFFIHGAALWSLATNLDRAGISQVLADRQVKGFNAVVFELIEHWFTSQSPRYRNKEGQDPFSPMTDFASPNPAYWALIDYAIAEASRRDMLCLLTPAYWGIPHNAHEGWSAEVRAAGDEALLSYGRFLGRRYLGQRNLVWVMGGDADVLGADQQKQNRIAEGILEVDPHALLTAHATTNSASRDVWSASWIALDLVYKWEAYGGYVWEGIERSRARLPARPCLLFEGQYENENGDPALCRRQAYQSVLAGGCGHFFGNNPTWHFNASGRDQTDWRTQLDTTATLQMRHVKSLFTAYPWWLLEPQTGQRLVVSDLGAGSARICPALAADRSFAMIWTPGTRFTADLAALAPAALRARWYDTLRGSYLPAEAGVVANSGARGFSPPGEAVLVLDAA